MSICEVSGKFALDADERGDFLVCQFLDESMVGRLEGCARGDNAGFRKFFDVPHKNLHGCI